VKPNGSGLGLIEEKRINSLTDVFAKSRPIIALGENVVRQAFSYITAVGLLRDTKNQFHTQKLPQPKV